MSRDAQDHLFDRLDARSRQRIVELHKEQISRLFAKVTVKGHSLIPVRVYLTRGKVKIELALAKGKKDHDKREDLKKREAQRDISRAMAWRGRQ